MSMYGTPETRPQPSMVEDGSRSGGALISSSPLFQSSSCLPDNRNSSPKNQTLELEDAFSRLCVSLYNPLPLDFAGHRSSLVNGSAKVFDFHGCWHRFPNPDIGQHCYTANAWAMSSPNCWLECDGNSADLNGLRPGSYAISNARGCSFSDDGFLSDSVPFSSPREFVEAFPTLTLPNGDVTGDDQLWFDFQQKSHGSILVKEGLFSNRPNMNIPGLNFNGRRPDWLHLRQRQQQQHLNQRSVNDLRGRILLLAKDQYGCRVLQERMKNSPPEDISFIFSELRDQLVELIVDPFGNYVVQKLVEVCSEVQRTRIILMVTQPDFQLVEICLNMHGTRAVQKLLEHVTTQEQRSLIMSALNPGAVALTKDTNGHHVILHCLNHFSPEDNKYLMNTVAKHCFGIATNKSGCCVLQQCVIRAEGETKRQLMAEIIANASVLAEDCFGNYVVQHLVSLKIPGVTESLLRQLEGKFFSLSCSKYGSNVVEKFFQDSGEQLSTRIVFELLHDPNVSMLLVDPYGNYVIKSALLVSKGAIRNSLLELIQIHSPMMRSNLYGKKLLARFDRGKLRHM